MNHEQTLKERFKQEEKEQKLALKQSKKEAATKLKEAKEKQEYEEHFETQTMLLAKKIDKMSNEEYNSFINATIKDILLHEARAQDAHEQAKEIKNSIRCGYYLDEDQISKIVLSHCFVLGVAGSIVGLICAPNEMENFATFITGFCAGGSIGILTAFTHYVCKDKNTLVNALKRMRIKMLEKKAAKLDKENSYNRTQLEELKEDKNCYSATGYASKASSAILEGVEKIQTEMFNTPTSQETNKNTNQSCNSEDDEDYINPLY